MPAIYYDPTENDTDTRLSDTILRAGSVLQGLEKFTGADLLVTPLNSADIPLTRVSEAMPHQIALKKHVEAGAFLIQRKSRRDLVNSITDLKHSLEKMQRVCAENWLVVIGTFTEGAGQVTVIDDQPTQWPYMAAIGAITSWQTAGGYVIQLQREQHLARWINNRIEKFNAPNEVQIVRTPKVKLSGPDAAIDILCAFPGIGPVGARALLDHFNGSLADCLVHLSNPRGDAIAVEGLRNADRKRARVVFTGGGKGGALGENEMLWRIDATTGIF